jgi:hypothetical protein
MNFKLNVVVRDIENFAVTGPSLKSYAELDFLKHVAINILLSPRFV